MQFRPVELEKDAKGWTHQLQLPSWTISGQIQSFSSQTVGTTSDSASLKSSGKCACQGNGLEPPYGKVRVGWTFWGRRYEGFQHIYQQGTKGSVVGYILGTLGVCESCQRLLQIKQLGPSCFSLSSLSLLLSLSLFFFFFPFLLSFHCLILVAGGYLGWEKSMASGKDFTYNTNMNGDSTIDVDLITIIDYLNKLGPLAHNMNWKALVNTCHCSWTEAPVVHTGLWQELQVLHHLS